MNTASTIASVAAANAISQERTAATISFPVTGDRELDLMSAWFAAVEAHPGILMAEVNRVLHYLCKRSDDALAQYQSPHPFQPYSTSPMPYTTSDGSLGPSGISSGVGPLIPTFGTKPTAEPPSVELDFFRHSPADAMALLDEWLRSAKDDLSGKPPPPRSDLNP